MTTDRLDDAAAGGQGPADPLLTPVMIGRLRLRNRILSTAHAPSFAEGGHPRERYAAYHVEKAKGGLALTMIGGSTNVSVDSPSVFGQLHAGDDTILPWFRALTAGVKTQGAAVMCQLTHMGRRTHWDDGAWLPTVAPSALRERAHRAIPKAIEASDVARIRADFARAARRCVEAGFDGIELLAHGHLLGQFLTPHANRREDALGGPLERRLAVVVDIVHAVREAIGPEPALGLRISGDESRAGGLTDDECVAIARGLAETGAVDFLNVVAGAPYDNLGLAEWVPPMGLDEAGHLASAGRIRAAVDVPVLAAGGVADLATARYGIKEGLVDMVGMTRAHMADPYLVTKLAAGEEALIRPCVGLGYCVDRVNQGKAAVCGHNVATGRELTLPHVIPRAGGARKRVVVVGGGPGGLEAARVAAARGHRVVLHEAAPRLGGQLLLAGAGTVRRQTLGVVEWLVEAVEREGVEVRLNSYVEAPDLLAEEADAIVLATGGLPAIPDVPGTERIGSVWDLLGGGARPEGHVVVYDEIGTHAAAIAAEVAARKGARVTFLTPDEMPLQELGPTTRAVALRALFTLGVAIVPNRSLAGLAPRGNGVGVRVQNTLTGVAEEIEADALVVENGTVPLDEVYHGLVPHASNAGVLGLERIDENRFDFPVANPSGRFVLARIGDAVASRNMHAAMLEGMRVAMSL
ncbi:oxidoreductase [Salinarimonas ramus]|uniref:N-methylproline demethylase n=1 Tax=Salinarimonas ramus TaxID=690164 RepID=A0A917Q7Q3_9HYPH|nr:FAD-dependent oxidoreductase [Salinarimonas ramus]GGK33849.1 N-methylproline demethylase [Salinarimonas ramus]